MKNYLRICVVVGILFLTINMGCESEDPLASISLNMTATSTQSGIDPNGRVASSDTVIFSEFLVGVKEIEFETLEEEAEEEDENGEEIEVEEEEIEFKGEFVVDVLNGTSNPDFGIAAIAPGVYSEIEMEMGPVLSNNKTISIKATATINSVDYLVEFTSNDDFELEIEREQGFSLTEGELSQILIVIDLDALFNGVDCSSASVDEDGVIRINENSNSSLSDIIENNLENALEAGEDDDDDNEIDD